MYLQYNTYPNALIEPQIEDNKGHSLACDKRSQNEQPCLNISACPVCLLVFASFDVFCTFASQSLSQESGIHPPTERHAHIPHPPPSESPTPLEWVRNSQDNTHGNRTTRMLTRMVTRTMRGQREQPTRLMAMAITTKPASVSNISILICI